MRHTTEELRGFVVSRTDSAFSVQWDNRSIPKCRFQTIFSLVWWLIWTPLTVYVSCAVWPSGEHRYFWTLWLIFAFAGVLIVPYLWVFRWSTERIEIDSDTYRHHFVGFPFWMQRNWDVETITEIRWGIQDAESATPYISVIRSKSWSTVWSQDAIAWWATTDTRRELFELLRDLLDSIGSPIPIVDDQSDEG